jgi:hypothetical protein
MLPSSPSTTSDLAVTGVSAQWRTGCARQVKNCETREVYVVNEVRDWIDSLDEATHRRVVQAIDTLADLGPGRPTRRHDPWIIHRQPQRATTRHGADPVRVRSVARQHPSRGRRQGRPLDTVVPRGHLLADQRYERYLKERRDEEEQQR